MTRAYCVKHASIAISDDFSCVTIVFRIDNSDQQIAISIDVGSCCAVYGSYIAYQLEQSSQQSVCVVADNHNSRIDDNATIQYCVDHTFEVISKHVGTIVFDCDTSNQILNAIHNVFKHIVDQFESCVYDK